MNKLKALYLHNAIIQFIVSYVFVLVLPLVICSVGIHISFQIVQDNLKTSNMDMLTHNIELIDADWKAVQTTALQISRNKQVLTTAGYKRAEHGNFYLDSKDAIEQVRTITTYNSSSMLESVMIYYGNSDYIQFNNSLYEKNFYYRSHVDQNQISKERWGEYLLAEDLTESCFRTYLGGLEWVTPIVEVDGDRIPGTVICRLNMDTFNSYFSPLGDSNGAELYLLDGQSNILYSINTSDSETELTEAVLKGTKGYLNYENKLIIYNSSIENPLQYILIIPEKQVMYKLNDFKRNSYLLILIAAGIGILAALYMSFRNGKPINEIFNIYLREEAAAGDVRDFGGVVSQILVDNKELLKEIEQEKPFIQSAFFNKLIHGNVVNEDELMVLLDKLDGDIITDSYIVLVFRIFANNDYYDIDSQTMEEGRVISHYIQNIMREHLNDRIWFSDVDYLTNIAVLPDKSKPKEGEEIARYVNAVLLEQYQVTPHWGISDVCTDLLDIWRACEQAKEALNQTEGEQESTITLYQDIIKFQTDYYFPKLFEEKLFQSVSAGDMEQVNILLSMSYKENFELRQISRSKFLKLNRRFYDSINSFNKNDKTYAVIEELSDFALNYKASSIENYYELLTKAFASICSERKQNKLGKRQLLTNGMTEYINAHYNDSNLGLSMLAAVFGISEGYVSTLFKEEIGKNFADYVEKLRIDRACILLRESEISISTIAEQVGYNSIQSFRRAFKKVIGKSPRDVRVNL